MAEGKENNNVHDFVAYRIERLAGDHMAQGDVANATALWEALDAYLAGLVTVSFIEGKTYITLIDNDGEATNKNNV